MKTQTEKPFDKAQDKHTPTPLKIYKRKDGVIELNRSDGSGIATMCIGYPYNHAIEHAEFIVRAVNSRTKKIHSVRWFLW